MATVKTLVLGGYGNFGARICRALAGDAATRHHIALLVAGQDASRAQALAEPAGGRDLVELQVLANGTLGGIAIAQDGVPLTVLPELVVNTGDLVVVHFNPPTGVTTELTTQTACADAACYVGAWDVHAGTTAITYSRRVLAVVDPYGDNQDVAAFSDLGTSPSTYPAQVQAVQTSGDGLPPSCGGAPCTDATSPSANDVSVDWRGAGTGPGNASVQRVSSIDTDTKVDWRVLPGTIGVANPGLCGLNERVDANTCVPCPTGESNAAGDAPSGPDTACDVDAVLRLTEVAPNQSGGRDFVELVALTGGTIRSFTIDQAGIPLATLPDITVSAGAIVVVHLTPGPGVTSTTASAANSAPNPVAPSSRPNSATPSSSPPAPPPTTSRSSWSPSTAAPTATTSRTRPSTAPGFAPGAPSCRAAATTS